MGMFESMDEAHSFYGKIGELYIFLNFITCLNFGPCLQLACFLREKRDDFGEEDDIKHDSELYNWIETFVSKAKKTYYCVNFGVIFWNLK